VCIVRVLWDSGDHSTVEPPSPIPNLEVKRCRADGSAAIGRARVGRCQFFSPPSFRSRKGGGVFFVPEKRAGALAVNLEMAEFPVARRVNSRQTVPRSK
jgi:hypothetical protein